MNGRGRSALPGSSTRALALFFLVNSILLNLLLAALPWTPERKTVFNYTARALIGRARSDPWTQMHVALQELRAAPDPPLYHHLFFHRHMRFPYAPPSLFLTALVERLPLDALRVLHLVSWLVLAGTVAICVRLFRQSMAEDGGSTGAGQVDRVAGPVLVAAFTLTFYPVVKGFTLGQIQTWLNLALAAALSSWMAGHEVRAGVLSALPCLVKPHYGLLLLWGLSRRRWRFCVAFGAVLGGAFLVSIAAFGWANHRDYLWMLAYVSAHGESFFANASANGVLQRALFNGDNNGDNLGWHEDAYPPFNAWVYGGTVLASLALASGCLLWRPRGSPRASAADLMLAILTCVMASPVAWEHHYGILMPFYAVLLPALVRRPVFGRATIPYLGASYVLTMGYLIHGSRRWATASFDPAATEPPAEGCAGALFPWTQLVLDPAGVVRKAALIEVYRTQVGRSRRLLRYARRAEPFARGEIIVGRRSMSRTRPGVTRTRDGIVIRLPRAGCGIDPLAGDRVRFRFSRAGVLEERLVHLRGATGETMAGRAGQPTQVATDVRVEVDERSVRLHLAADPFFTVPGIFVEVLPPDDARVGAAWAFLWSSHPAADPSGGPPR